jgi:hypothetical protein
MSDVLMMGIYNAKMPFSDFFPLLQIISHPTIWNQEFVGICIHGVAYVITFLWDLEVISPSAIEHTVVRGTALPPRQDVDEFHVDG